MRRVAAVVGILLVTAGAASGSAAAATPARTAWWERALGSLVPTPPPAPVPDGGLRVANFLDGPTAVAALRYEPEPDSVPLALTLGIAAARGTPEVIACRSAAAWEPAQGGPMGDAPQTSCSSGVRGVPSDDGTTLAFDVSSLRDGNVLDVVLTPGNADGGLPVSASFDVVFTAPDEASLVTEPAPPGGDEATPTSAPTASAGDALLPPSDSGLALPPAVTIPPAPAPATQPPALQQEVRPAIRAGETARRPSVLGMALLAAGVALLAMALTGNPSRVAWALGGSRRAGSDDGTIAGLDRWAKPRHGSPPGI